MLVSKKPLSTYLPCYDKLVDEGVDRKIIKIVSSVHSSSKSHGSCFSLTTLQLTPQNEISL